MDLNGISELTEKFSLDKILGGDFTAFWSLFYLALSIAVYSVLIYHFYRYIARRDCFKPSIKKHSTTISFLKYAFLFPFVAIIFFMGFSLMLLFLSKSIEVQVVLSTAFAIILAIRITAYYTDDLSRDVAKMLPFALLGIFLIDPSYFVFDDVIARINTLPEFINTAIQFIIFLIIVEWILRIILVARYKIFPKKENTNVKGKNKIPSSC
jgi:hypothetical protein